MKLSYFVGLLSWASIFALIWLSLFEMLGDISFSKVFWVFLGFVLMALIASIASSAEEKKREENREQRRNVSKPKITRTDTE